MLPKEISIVDFTQQASPTIVQLARHFGVREAAAVEAYAHIIMLRPKEAVPTFEDCLQYLRELVKRDVRSLTEEEVRVGVCLGLLRLKQRPIQATHIGRNEPCPCGSGAKYKKCCLDNHKE